MPLEISGVKFATQTEAIKFVNSMIAENGRGTIKLGHKNFDFILELFKRHPTKGELPVSEFYILPNSFGQLELSARINGSKEVFSYSSCVRRRAKAESSKLHSAMRESILDQVWECKSTGFCGICGKEITISCETNVDHIKHFHKIRDEFIDLWAGDLPTEFNSPPHIGGRVSFMITDIRFRAAWQEFHREHAELRVTHKICNLKRGKRDKPLEQSLD